MAEITADFKQLLAADKQVFPSQELLSENLPLNTSLDEPQEHARTKSVDRDGPATAVDDNNNHNERGRIGSFDSVDCGGTLHQIRGSNLSPIRGAPNSEGAASEKDGNEDAHSRGSGYLSPRVLEKKEKEVQ